MDLRAEGLQYCKGISVSMQADALGPALCNLTVMDGRDFEDDEFGDNESNDFI